MSICTQNISMFTITALYILDLNNLKIEAVIFATNIASKD